MYWLLAQAECPLVSKRWIALCLVWKTVRIAYLMRLLFVVIFLNFLGHWTVAIDLDFSLPNKCTRIIQKIMRKVCYLLTDMRKSFYLTNVLYMWSTVRTGALWTCAKWVNCASCKKMLLSLLSSEFLVSSEEIGANCFLMRNRLMCCMIITPLPHLPKNERFHWKVSF